MLNSIFDREIQNQPIQSTLQKITELFSVQVPDLA